MLLPGIKRFLLVYLLLSSTKQLCGVRVFKAVKFLQMSLSVDV